mmetsp:Transcript_67068/g.160013  ORF Transcript_67068/g.160013 Transcript_67068/m.160013 type:complete len:309 (+) Transcript_67068:1322-2248(+)
MGQQDCSSASSTGARQLLRSACNSRPLSSSPSASSTSAPSKSLRTADSEAALPLPSSSSSCCRSVPLSDCGDFSPKAGRSRASGALSTRGSSDVDTQHSPWTSSLALPTTCASHQAPSSSTSTRPEGTCEGSEASHCPRSKTRFRACAGLWARRVKSPSSASAKISLGCRRLAAKRFSRRSCRSFRLVASETSPSSGHRRQESQRKNFPSAQHAPRAGASPASRQPPGSRSPAQGRRLVRRPLGSLATPRGARCCLVRSTEFARYSLEHSAQTSKSHLAQRYASVILRRSQSASQVWQLGKLEHHSSG